MAIPIIQRRIFETDAESTTSPSTSEFLLLVLSSTWNTRGSVFDRESPRGLATFSFSKSGDEGEVRFPKLVPRDRLEVGAAIWKVVGKGARDGLGVVPAGDANEEVLVAVESTVKVECKSPRSMS
jgi:hypothetical protein